jgi:hypothetical protein
LPAGSDQATYARDLQANVEDAGRLDTDLFTSDVPALGHSTQPALTLDLMIVEDPITTYVSPITRVVNGIFSLFGDPPDPARHLIALARNLRVPTGTNHVRVQPGPDPGESAAQVGRCLIVKPPPVPLALLAEA